MRQLALGLVLILIAAPIMAVNIHVPADEPTIQIAVNTALPDDTIVVADGRYTGEGFTDIDFHGKEVYVRSENGPLYTIIDCNGSDSTPCRAFLFDDGEGPGAVIDGFSIINGFGPGDGPPTGTRQVGGAIYFDSLSSPTIRNCTFAFNQALDGGSIYSYFASPVIVNCLFGQNADGTFGGGAIYMRGGSMTIHGTSFRDNKAYYGGAVYLSGGGSAQLTDCNFDFDSANIGGALFMGDASATIDSCSFTANMAEKGAGIYGGSAEISWSTFERNQAGSQGAGIAATDASIVNCTMFDNSAPAGVIYGGSLNMSNSIIAFNQAYSLTRSTPVSIECSNIHGNTEGDWTTDIRYLADIAGNQSYDPRFCDPEIGDIDLWYASPCLPDWSGGCGPIGARRMGCSPEWIRPVSSQVVIPM